MKQLLLVVTLLAASSVSAATYDLQLLTGISHGAVGTEGSQARGINEAGVVVGTSYNAVTGEREAAIWTNGSVQSINTGTAGVARAINNNGEVVGETGDAQLFVPNGEAFHYDTGTSTFSGLGTLGGTYSGAYDINDQGTIVGFSMTNNQNGAVTYTHGFTYSGGVMGDLAPANNSDGYSRGHGINESGLIVGRSSVDLFGNSDKHMATWTGAGTATLDPGPYTYSTAQDVNESGVIVGNGHNADGIQRGMVWTESGITIFGTFGGNQSRAWAINDNGTIVGYAQDATNTRQAMISLDGVNMLLLEDLVVDMGDFVELNEAYDINNAGQVVGYGTLSSGEQAAFLLNTTVVPIPAAAWLFGSALGLLGWVRRRRQVV